jgi:hypothetical protein
MIANIFKLEGVLVERVVGQLDVSWIIFELQWRDCGDIDFVAERSWQLHGLASCDVSHFCCLYQN